MIKEQNLHIFQHRLQWNIDFSFMNPFHQKNQKASLHGGAVTLSIIYVSGILVLVVERGHINILSVSGCMTVSGTAIMLYQKHEQQYPLHGQAG